MGGHRTANYGGAVPGKYISGAPKPVVFTPKESYFGQKPRGFLLIPTNTWKLVGLPPTAGSQASNFWWKKIVSTARLIFCAVVNYW